MRLEIVPGVGVGPVCLGMSPRQVLDVFPEEQKWEHWMGGNLNDALLFHGLVFIFDKCESAGPLPDARLERIFVRGREDAMLLGKPVSSWDKSAIVGRLRDEGHTVEEWTEGYFVERKIWLSFTGDQISFIDIYVDY